MNSNNIVGIVPTRNDNKAGIRGLIAPRDQSVDAMIRGDGPKNAFNVTVDNNLCGTSGIEAHNSANEREDEDFRAFVGEEDKMKTTEMFFSDLFYLIDQHGARMQTYET